MKITERNVLDSQAISDPASQDMKHSFPLLQRVTESSIKSAQESQTTETKETTGFQEQVPWEISTAGGEKATDSREIFTLSFNKSPFSNISLVQKYFKILLLSQCLADTS